MDELPKPPDGAPAAPRDAERRCGAGRRQRRHRVARAAPAGDGLGATCAQRVAARRRGARLHPEPARQRARLGAHRHHRRRSSPRSPTASSRDYLRALHDAFLPAGFQVLVLNSRYEPAEEEKAIATMLGQHPEAMILAGIDQSDQARRMLDQAGIPVVQTMELTDDPIDINIGFSQHDAGYAATRHLLDLGHRRIAPYPRAARRPRPAAHRGLPASHGGRRPRYRRHDRGLADSRRRFALGARLFAELLARAAGASTRSSPATTTSRSAPCSSATGAASACPRTSRSSASTTSRFAPPAFPSLSSVATPRYEMARQAAAIVTRIIRGDGERPTIRSSTSALR